MNGASRLRTVETQTAATLNIGNLAALTQPRALYALRDAGEIEQVGRGVYWLSTATALSSPDLVPIAIRIPRAVIWFLSALTHNSQTTPILHVIDIAPPVRPTFQKSIVCEFQTSPRTISTALATFKSSSFKLTVTSARASANRLVCPTATSFPSLPGADVGQVGRSKSSGG